MIFNSNTYYFDVILLSDNSFLSLCYSFGNLNVWITQSNKPIYTFNTWTALIANNYYINAAKLLMTRECIVFNWTINRLLIRFISSSS